MPTLAEIAAFLDTTLSVASIPDYPNALNGVQLANLGGITRVATAVDYSSRTVDGAIGVGARLLLVHHGMFWGGAQAITGQRHRQLWSLVTHDVAVYAAHLPLDVHPRYRTNVLLAHRLGLAPSDGFARYQSIHVGVSGAADVGTHTLVDRAERLARE